jgi:NodT family efflux transporter outer membrane factor (OMF) lipoprotein
LNSAYHEAVHRLGVLLGREPSALLAELESAAAIPTVPPTIAVGLPADLVRRRADIRRAERELAAQTARVGVATADLYPKFTLFGSFGFQSSQFADMFDMNSRAWSFGPGMSWSIFNGDRVRSAIEVQDARTEQALGNYERTVLTGLEDAENALTRYAQEQVRRDALVQSVAANRRAVELANFLYTSGVKDFLNVLVSQRALFESEDQLAQSERTVASNLIALYKALGGGWEAEEARFLPPSPAPEQQAREDGDPQEG